MRTFSVRILIIACIVIGLRTAQAENPTLSTVDLVAPEIIAIKAPDHVRTGAELTIEAQVKDDRGVKSVAIYFRHHSSGQYIKQEMIRGSDKNDYFSAKKNVSGPVIEYYVEAVDLAGNLVRSGQDFAPLRVSVLSELDSSIIKNLKPGPLDDEDILTLFSDNTVDGRHLRKNFTFTRYFAADGRLIGFNDHKGKRTGHWRVEKKMLCEQFDEQQESCREIVKEGNTIKKYATTRKGDRVVAIIYKRFRYGNPENF